MNTLVHRFVNNDINQAGCVELKVWVKKAWWATSDRV